MILISKKNTILSSSVYSNQQTHNLDLAICTLIRFRVHLKILNLLKDSCECDLTTLSLLQPKVLEPIDNIKIFINNMLMLMLYINTCQDQKSQTLLKLLFEMLFTHSLTET